VPSYRHRRMPVALTAMLVALLLMSSCTPGGDSEDVVSSPPQFAEGYEIIADQPFLPGQLESQAVLVEDPLRMPALWDHYKLGGDAASFRKGSEVALFVGTGESGSCPIEIEDVEVIGDDVTIHTADTDGPCTADFVPRTFVFLFRTVEAPASGGTVTIQGFELPIDSAEEVAAGDDLVFPVQEPSNFQMDALLEGIWLRRAGVCTCAARVHVGRSSPSGAMGSVLDDPGTTSLSWTRPERLQLAWEKRSRWRAVWHPGLCRRNSGKR
jgi:hypothetical protein